MNVSFTLPVPSFRWNQLNPSEWIVIDEFYIQIFDYAIRIPSDFTSDLASVPRLLRWIFPRNGRWTPAALVHDYLYCSHAVLDIRRKDADKIFLLLMLAYNVTPSISYIFYLSVRCFGWLYWNKDK